VAKQRPPEPSDRQPIWELVIADMQERNRVGTERHGTPLQAFNGRDALQDAYEEVLDLAAYLRQAIEERGAKGPLPEEVGCSYNVITGEHYTPCVGTCKGEG
jgi:hypothetical protein